MKNVFSIKIDRSIMDKMKEFCKSHGLKQGFFVEKAIMERLEKEEMLEDMLDLKQLSSQEKSAIGVSEYLKKRKA